ncbi:MAG: hypothetical protein JNL19_09230 [Burkholderiales bacterium]|nr:hypothetical protein [Burkholderiales bacterium]
MAMVMGRAQLDGMLSADALLEDVAEAHGGYRRWNAVECIEADLCSGGFAFASHGQRNALKHLRISVHPHSRRVVLRDFHTPGWTGLWTPQRVQLRDERGALFRERADPRYSFRRFVKNFAWDELDMLYFAGYALWNYLSFPFLLLSAGVDVREPMDGVARRQRELWATFDPSIITHSATQRFVLTRNLHLTRHDYTADVIGRWAKAANLCTASEVVDGLRFYTRRVVYPQLGRDRHLPFPTLVWIELDNLRVQFDGAAGHRGAVAA